jgi:1-phosphatidylinositol-4-phosphate 5-kinase
MKIPREGNHYAPGHQGRYDYKFKTYAPFVFLYLRHHFGITDGEYMNELTGDYMMSELQTIGRSSAMFYFTWDGKYILKTLTKNEMLCLRRMLPGYYQYVTQHPDTFVNKFFGAYRSQTSVGRPIRFVIMNNVFPIGFQIHYKFDLKGSVVNRFVPEEKRNRPGSTWKDAEFQQRRYLEIGPRDWSLLRSQLQDDTQFLASAQVMDYSLLVGIHELDRDSRIMHPAMGERTEILSVFTPDRSSQSRYTGNSVIIRNVQLRDRKKGKKGKKGKKVKKVMAEDKAKVHFGVGQCATVMPYTLGAPKLQSFFGGIRGSNGHDEPLSEIYFIGIIDFLQYYGAGKATEHFFKRVVYDKDEMSCVPPDRYATRMFQFLVRTIGPAEPLSQDQERQLFQRTQRLLAMAQPVNERRGTEEDPARRPSPDRRLRGIAPPVEEDPVTASPKPTDLKESDVSGSIDSVGGPGTAEPTGKARKKNAQQDESGPRLVVKRNEEHEEPEPPPKPPKHKKDEVQEEQEPSPKTATKKQGEEQEGPPPKKPAQKKLEPQEGTEQPEPAKKSRHKRHEQQAGVDVSTTTSRRNNEQADNAEPPKKRKHRHHEKPR